jgi:tetratricopeptide (TPR) repeat protein
MRTAILVLVLAMTSAARADKVDSATQAKADALFEKGQAMYLSDQFQGAIELFKQAYELVRDPVYLFNIAQSYRKVADCEGSFDYYTQYLQAAPDAENKAKVQQWLRELEPCVEDRKREHDAAQRAEQLERERKEEEARRQLQPALPPPLPPRDTEVDSGGGWRAAGYIGMAIGAVGLGAAAFYSVEGAGARDDLKQLCAGGCVWTDPKVHALDSDGQTANTRAKIGYIGGGIAAVAGVALYMIGRTRVEHVIVSPTAGGAAVTAQVRF